MTFRMQYTQIVSFFFFSFFCSVRKIKLGEASACRTSPALRPFQRLHLKSEVMFMKSASCAVSADDGLSGIIVVNTSSETSPGTPLVWFNFKPHV